METSGGDGAGIERNGSKGREREPRGESGDRGVGGGARFLDARIHFARLRP